MLPEKQINEIREELQNCKRPLFFFDDDPDGLSSFLLLYRYVREGSGVVIKTIPNIDNKFLRKVEEYQPDKIFVLDVAKIEQDFIDTVKIPIIWIDHLSLFALPIIFKIACQNNGSEIRFLSSSYIAYKVLTFIKMIKIIKPKVML